MEKQKILPTLNGRNFLLGFQHVFAMFGATVLVPLITGLNVSTTLLAAGLGTLLFHFITKGKVPAFLGSSFAFLGGFAAVAPKLADGSPNLEMLPYACGGVVASGLIYIIVAFLVKGFGVKKVMKFFPPIVTGPIIISIGLILAPNAINSASTNWFLAIIALSIIIICNIWGKGMIKIIPILLSVVISYAVAIVTNSVDFSSVISADWVGI
ncbi:MAG: solute carrier family 23 protein, partial [Oscillospiraceae bacterium]